MNNAKLAKLVAEAVALDREVAEKSDRLKEIKGDLLAMAESETSEKTETSGGGWSVVFEGAEGCIARVTQPGDKLKANIDPESKPGKLILSLLGKYKDDYFVSKKTLQPVLNFRAQVSAAFGGREAKRILELMTSESKATLSFETKETL
jgi:hypothetical protein